MKLAHNQLKILIEQEIRRARIKQNVHTLIEHEAAAVILEHNDQVETAQKLAYGYWKHYGSIGHKVTLREYSTACNSSLPLIGENRVAEFGRDHAKDLIQAAIGWTVKIGGDAGLAVGVPAGEAAEVAVDAFFAAESIAAVTTALDAIWAASDEFAELTKNLAQIDLNLGPERIYAAVMNIVGQVIKAAEAGGIPVEEYLDKASDKVEELIKKAAKSVSKGLGVIIPIPGIDIVIQEGIMSLGNNAFDIVATIYGKLPDKLKQLFLVPGAIEKFINDILGMVVNFIEFLNKEKEDQGFFEKAGKEIFKGLFPPARMAASIAGMLDIGPKIVAFLQKEGPGIAKNLGVLFAQVAPYLFAALAFYQIVARREWEDLSSSPISKFPLHGRGDKTDSKKIKSNKLKAVA